MEEERTICKWCRGDPLLMAYHETEWGVPVHDDHRHFEYLALEVMQCGLNWLLVLKKREAIRQAFCDFDFEKVAAFTQADIVRAMEIPGMIRSANKIKAVAANAGIFREIQREYGSFDRWIWSFTDGMTWIYQEHDQIWEAATPLSDKISAALKKRGMKYLGSVTVYAYLQAVGMVNDHERGCWLYQHVAEQFPVRVISKRRPEQVQEHFPRNGNG